MRLDQVLRFLFSRRNILNSGLSPTSSRSSLGILKNITGAQLLAHLCDFKKVIHFSPKGTGSSTSCISNTKKKVVCAPASLRAVWSRGLHSFVIHYVYVDMTVRCANSGKEYLLPKWYQMEAVSFLCSFCPWVLSFSFHVWIPCKCFHFIRVLHSLQVPGCIESQLVNDSWDVSESDSGSFE